MEGIHMTCILCPMGCSLCVEESAPGVVSVSGNGCKRGETYGVQERVNPVRVVTGSVRVDGGALPLCPVKTSIPVPKAKIQDVLSAVRAARTRVPVQIGQIIAKNVANTGADLIATDQRE